MFSSFRNLLKNFGYRAMRRGRPGFFGPFLEDNEKVNSLFAGSRTSAKARSFVPMLEHLEDRLAPASNHLLSTGLDHDFAGGSLTTSRGHGADVAILADNSSIVAGNSELRAFHADGTPNTNFGGGIVATDFRPLGVAVQTDGKIIEAGDSDSNTFNNVLVVARYNSDGTLDTAFDPVGHDGE